MKSRILCICSTAAIMGGALLFNGCASVEDDRLPPGAYVPPAPKPNPPPENSSGKVDEVEPAQPKTVITSENKPEPLPPPPPKKAEKPEKPEKQGKTVIHVVKKGDTFWKLAAAYGITTKEIAEANPGVSPNKLYVGRKLVIPASSGKKTKNPAPHAKDGKTGKKVKKTSVKASAPGEKYYIVRKGDSFAKIAAKNKIKAADLAAANKLSLEKPLWVGQKLIIPKSTAKSVKAVKKVPAAPAKKNAAGKTQKTAASNEANKKEDPLPTPPQTSSNQETVPPAPVPPPDLSVLNEPAAPKAAPAASANIPASQTSETIKEDISIGAYADKVGFDIQTLRRYNPNLPAEGILRAGTVVKLP